MATSKYYSFVNFLLLCQIFQNNILISAEANCLNPTFKKDQKIVGDYFSSADTVSLSLSLCEIILKSNGLLSVINHPSSDLKNKAKCMQSESCTNNRFNACYYKIYTDIYNTCPIALPPVDPNVADCICMGSADDVLSSNEALRIKYGIQTLPALVLNGVYDKCFQDYTLDGMITYFCKAYKNELPVCKKRT